MTLTPSSYRARCGMPRPWPDPNKSSSRLPARGPSMPPSASRPADRIGEGPFFASRRNPIKHTSVLAPLRARALTPTSAPFTIRVRGNPSSASQQPAGGHHETSACSPPRHPSSILSLPKSPSPANRNAVCTKTEKQGRGKNQSWEGGVREMGGGLSHQREINPPIPVRYGMDVPLSPTAGAAAAAAAASAASRICA